MSFKILNFSPASKPIERSTLATFEKRMFFKSLSPFYSLMTKQAGTFSRLKLMGL
jgi:hypothetical protein